MTKLDKLVPWKNRSSKRGLSTPAVNQRSHAPPIRDDEEPGLAQIKGRRDEQPQDERRRSARDLPDFPDSDDLDIEAAKMASLRPDYLMPAHAARSGPGEPPSAKQTGKGSRSPEREPTRSRGVLQRGDKIEDLRHELRNLKRENRDLDDDLRTAKKDVKDQSTEIRRLRQELQKAEHSAEQGRRCIDKDHAREIYELSQNLKTARNDATEKERRLTQDHQSKLDDLSRDLRTAKSEASQKESRVAKQHADAVENLNQKIQHVRNEAEAKERSTASGHARAINGINEAHAVQLSKRAQEHDRNTRFLQLQIEEVNEAWLNRDDEIYQSKLFTTSGLPHKPDDKIKAQVLELQQLVDDLGRAEWKPSPESWTDRIFQRTGDQHGRRSVEKAIVQGLIWTLLFHRVFRSPFRMFGEAGKNLELEWNERCGKEKSDGDELYIWPAPGIKTERWRYMTVKECREILTTPIPSQVDKRAEIKRGFKTSQDKLIIALKDDLGRIVQLTAQDTQLVEKLAKKAAVTWLDFAMHRCRIVIRPTAEVKPTAEKASMMSRGQGALTTLPRVGRYGNFKGMELDRFTEIKGFEGKMLDIT